MNPIKKILIADDSSIHRTFFKTNLRLATDQLGIKFEILGEAEGGVQLFDLYSAQIPGSIDFVFSDIRMPIMDGLSALVKIRKLSPRQKMVMVSSEDIQKMDLANSNLGETDRKTLEINQRMELLNKVAERIRNNTVEEGKTNSILIGCEKLVLDPIWVAEQYGACGYLRKPYDQNKTKEMLQHLLNPSGVKFLAKA